MSITQGANIHLHFKFQLSRQILSDFTIFDNAFRRISTYRPVVREPEVGAQMCWHTSGRGPRAAHFGSPARFDDVSYKNVELGHFS